MFSISAKTTILKHTLFFVFCSFFITESFGQTARIEWIHAFGGESSDASYATTVDLSGNVYTAGRFGDGVDFDPGSKTTTLATKDNFDIFIHKLNKDGEFVWIKSLSGAEQGAPRSITTDQEGNIYVTGVFDHMVDFDPGQGVYEVQSKGSGDVFVLKLSTDGDFIWVKTFGGKGHDRSSSISLGIDGGIYLTGQFQDTVNFDPSTSTHSIASKGDNVKSNIFMLKLNTNGDFKWVRTVGASTDIVTNASCLDANNNLCLTGDFTGIADFNTGLEVFELNAGTGPDIFILKLSSKGEFVWARSFETTGPLYITANSIVCDVDANICLTGIFSGQIDFDPNTELIEFEITSKSSKGDAFVAKISTTGAPLWVKTMSGESLVHGLTIAVDNSSNIYTAGIFVGATDFDPSDMVHQLSPGMHDGYLQKLDADGNFLWVEPLVGSGIVTPTSMYLTKDNTIHITGSFYQGLAVNIGDVLFNFESKGYYDFFCLKLSEPLLGLSDENVEERLSIFPNPSKGQVRITLEGSKSTNTMARVEIITIKGQVTAKSVLHKNGSIEFNNLQKGYYLIRVSNDQGLLRMAPLIVK